MTGIVAIFADCRFSIGKLYVETGGESSNERGLFKKTRGIIASATVPCYNGGMEKATDRLIILIGEDGAARLAAAKVAVVGLGGVGGQAAEAIARSFVGTLVLVDGDRVNKSNANRQILATAENVGREKALVAAERARAINPNAKVTALPVFVTAENLAELDIWDADCIVDAIDDVAAKVALIKEAHRRGVRIVSSMGAANRFDPMAFKVADISETHTCPLAKKLRKLLAAQGIENGVTVVYSTERPLSFGGALGSNAFVPPAAGLLAAKAAIDMILKEKE